MKVIVVIGDNERWIRYNNSSGEALQECGTLNIPMGFGSGQAGGITLMHLPGRAWRIRSYEYGEQDRKAAILYEYDTFKDNEGEQLLDTYTRFLQVINDLKKCGFKKDNYLEESDDEDIIDLKKITALLAKAFNRKKFYSKPTNNNLRTSSTSTSANKKSEDFRKAKIKDYNYYKIKMLLEKKDSDDQVLLAEDQALMEISSDSKEELSANMVFVAKMENILSDSVESSSFDKNILAEVSHYSSDSESESDFDETSNYYENSEPNYGLFMDNENDQEIFHDAIELASENFDENLVVS
ncbi:hypothetical protein Tco_0472219 [Tanacetum coccineum]